MDERGAAPSGSPSGWGSLRRSIFDGGLRRQVVVWVVLVQILLAGGVVSFSTWREWTNSVEESRRNAVTLSRSLAIASSPGVLNRDLMGLRTLLDGLRENQDLRYAILADRQGRILAHTRSELVGRYMADLPDSVGGITRQDDSLFDRMEPVSLYAEPVGWARIGIDRTREGEKMARIVRERVLAGLFAVITGSLLAFLVADRLSRRMRRLLEVVHRRENGDPSARVGLQGRDEPAVLGAEMDRMFEMLSRQEAELRERQLQLEDLNRSLAERLDQQRLQLQEKELLYRALFTMAPDAFLIMEEGDGRISDCNLAAEAILGGTRDQILGTTPDKLSPPFQEDGIPSTVAAQERIRFAYEHGFHRFEWIHRRFDGSDFWADVALFVLNHQGRRSMFVSWRDISERKRLEQRLRDAHALNERIISTATIGIIAFRNDGTCIFANREVARISGGSLEEMYALDFHKLDNWRDNGLHELALEVLATGENKSLDSDIVTSFGVRRFLSFSLSRFFHEKVPHFLMMVVDNSERRKAEENAYRLAAIVENSGDAILRKSLDGTIESWNRAAEDILGYRGSELIGTHFRNFVPEDALAQEIWMFQRALSGEVVHFEGDKLHSSGRIVECASTMSPIYSEADSIVGVATIIRDISVEKKLQRDLDAARRAAERANQAKSAFLANMSHEIRTPLNGIIGLGRMLESTPLTPMQGDYLAKLNSSSRSLLGILNDILDFSKIEAGHLELESISFSIEKVLLDVVNLFSLRASEKGLEIVLRLDRDLPLFFLGDPHRLAQIINNLVGNALKFANRGEILVEVRFHALEDSRARLTFSVTDSGIGIPEEACQHLFKPFVQADGSTTRKFGGTGLGLSICKSLVEKMDGEISVRSRLGHGSTFTFDIRLGVDLLRSRIPGVERLAGTRVLVVEDQQASREILCRLLEAWSCQVTSVPSGEEALIALHRQEVAGRQFQFALVDWMLPGFDGVNLVSRISSKVESGMIKVPPVMVVVTAFDEDRIRNSAGAVGSIPKVLTKPVDPVQLLRTLTESLDGRGAQEGKPAGGPPALASQVATVSMFHGARILVVDDNEINRMVAEALLVRLGAQVSTACDGRHALEMVRKGGFDLVCMDVQMPVMDGYEATRAIRALEDESTRIPIVAMSAGAMVEDRDLSLAAGMDEHITKPLEPDQVAMVIGNLLPARLRSGSDSRH